MPPALLGLSDDTLTWLVPLAIAGGFVLYKLTRWSAHVDKDRVEFRAFMDKVSEDIKNILSRLPPAPVAGSSPLKLTDFGVQLSEYLKAEEWAARQAPSLKASVAGMEAFEVDKRCQTIVGATLDDGMERDIARCAYDHGIEPNAVRSVLRVVLRDALLESVDLKPG